MSDMLRRLTQQRQHIIAIFAEQGFFFPWTLLYDRHPLDFHNIDPEGFWGFKHVIEIVPQLK